MSDALRTNQVQTPQSRRVNLTSFLRRIASKLGHITVPFELILPDGRRQLFGTGSAAFVVILRNAAGVRAAMTLDEGRIADAYVFGDIDIEGDMLKPFELKSSMSDRHIFIQAWRFIKPLLFGQVRTNRDAIHSHYDIDPEFFLSFLDSKTPCYTQGIYEHDDENLEAATTRKLDYVFRRLRLKPGDDLLEVGPGWGAWFEYASARGVKCTGLSISQASIDYLNHRAKTLGCDWKLIFSDLLEYQTAHKYDAIVIMGVIEHLPDYEAVLNKFVKLLNPGGRIFLDGSASRRKFEMSSFMAKHVYGGNHSFLALPDLLKKLSKTPLECEEIFNDSHSYFLTLRQWAMNLDSRRDEVVHRFGAYNFRRFRLYLWGAAQAFLRRDMFCYRMILHYPNATFLNIK